MSSHPTISFLFVIICACFLSAETPASMQKKGQPENQKASVKQSDGIQVSRSAIALDIEDREPKDTSNTFPAAVKRLYCFTEIKNGAGHEIQHRWYWKDEMLSAVSLKINSDRYRTHSIKTILPNMEGDWRIAIVDSKNESVLKMLRFEIK